MLSGWREREERGVEWKRRKMKIPRDDLNSFDNFKFFTKAIKL